MQWQSSYVCKMYETRQRFFRNWEVSKDSSSILLRNIVWLRFFHVLLLYLQGPPLLYWSVSEVMVILREKSFYFFETFEIFDHSLFKYVEVHLVFVVLICVISQKNDMYLKKKMKPIIGFQKNFRIFNFTLDTSVVVDPVMQWWMRSGLHCR